MTQTLHVPKRYGNYADTLLMLGLAQLVERVQRDLYGLTAVTLIDRSTHYELKLAKDIAAEEAANLSFFNLFQPVKGAKTDVSGIPLDTDFFDTVKESQERSRYREWMRLPASEKQKLSEAEQPEPAFDPRTQNGVILTAMRHDRNHNALWLSTFELESDFGALLAAILEAFDADQTTGSNVAQTIAQLFKKRSGKSLPKPASAVKVFLPTSVQGVSRSKADSNQLGSSQTEEWVILWLIAAGLLEFGVSERVKVAESTYDWRVVALEPKEISLFEYSKALKALRQTNPPSGGFGIARFDAEMVLKFCQTLLGVHPATEVTTQPQGRRRRGMGASLKTIVGGFSGTHFNSKGQVYGVKEVFSLGLPDWIRPSNKAEINEYQDLLLEHLSVLRSLSADEGHSELLAAYRDFLTSSINDTLNQFFRFQISYADHVTKQFASRKAKYRPRLFSQEGLNIMTESIKKDLKLITENPGFIRIARAINSSTIYAGTIKDRDGKEQTLEWERVYGLAQRLGNCAASKTEFTAELMAFLARYEDENFRLQSRGKEVKRIWTRKEDLDQVIALLDQFPTSLVANLLIAYGFARWRKPLQDEPQDAPVDTAENAQESDELTSENVA
ncbi:hypothetical protein [Leptolyngbya sp. FACHB-711]|uniref:hypothetical protein n=1 Tax=Leptolyngbya sp. FACHB-711 TaxID=2692813 RepID=UPI00168A0105|nr:hypothetical protein [Leptolyngbya sp. FACHB-711]MBD2027010.1 hypothetical protein [Leptolyngbya sp. FACHB-711]